MRICWPFLLSITLVNASSWFGSSDPVDCSSILSPSSTSTSSSANQAYSAPHSISNIAAQATHEVARAFDNTKDYLYSTWDDSHLRKWLEEHGVVEARNAKTHTELTNLANHYFHKVSDPVWHSWSDSYMREWLVAHNLVPPHELPSRETLMDHMKHYYYSVTEKVWNTWSESELKAWLIEHGILKSDAKRQRDELVELVEDHYMSASDSVWGAWSDSDIHEWLAARGYIDATTSIPRRKRDDLVNLINSKYSDVSEKSASYLVWPDARLRAYLREHGVAEEALPTSRPGLLQETRIRWVQASTQPEGIFAKLRALANSGVATAKNALGWVHEATFKVGGESTKRDGDERIKNKGDEF
ncbi:hypothetical protein V8B97DRAFT_1993253 [Scleroderma yunnanense]